MEQFPCLRSSRAHHFLVSQSMATSFHYMIARIRSTTDRALRCWFTTTTTLIIAWGVLWYVLRFVMREKIEGKIMETVDQWVDGKKEWSHLRPFVSQRLYILSSLHSHEHLFPTCIIYGTRPRSYKCIQPQGHLGINTIPLRDLSKGGTRIPHQPCRLQGRPNSNFDFLRNGRKSSCVCV